MRHIVFGAVPLLGMALAAGAATSFEFNAYQLFVNTTDLEDADADGSYDGSVTFSHDFGGGNDNSDLFFFLDGVLKIFKIDSGFTLTVTLNVDDNDVSGSSDISDGSISIGVPSDDQIDTYTAAITSSLFDSFLFDGTFVDAEGFTISGDFDVGSDGEFDNVNIGGFAGWDDIAGTFVSLGGTGGANDGYFENFAAIPLPTPVLLAAGPVMGICAMRRRALT